MAVSAQACDIAPPPQAAWDGSEKIPGWTVYKFQPAAPVSGHLLFARIPGETMPDKRRAGRFIESRVRSATSGLFHQRITAAKVEMVEDKTLQYRNAGTKAFAFVVIVGFGPDSVRASGYLRENTRARSLSLQFAVTHPDDVNAAFPLVEQFASHPGHECGPGDGP